MTDMTPYRDAFLSDAKTSFTQIRTAISILRSKMDDADALFEALRLFHSLKSSSGMMNYEKMSKTCYEQEKLFMAIQEKNAVLTPAILENAEKAVEEFETELGL